jgi:hypothetical protein
MTGWVRPALAPGGFPNGAALEMILDEIDAMRAAWTTWTPTLTNLTQGNGTVLARYHQIGKTVRYRFRFVLGSTSAVGAAPVQITLPVTPGDYTEFTLGICDYTDAGVANRFGVVRLVSGSTVNLLVLNTSAVLPGVATAVPHAWGTGDSISVWGHYEAA